MRSGNEGKKEFPIVGFGYKKKFPSGDSYIDLNVAEDSGGIPAGSKLSITLNNNKKSAKSPDYLAKLIFDTPLVRTRSVATTNPRAAQQGLPFNKARAVVKSAELVPMEEASTEDSGDDLL